MKKLILPNVRIKISPEVSVPSPRREFVELLDKDESAVKKYIKRIEKSAAFNALQKRGVIRINKFKRKVPVNVYEEFKDKELINILNEYDISSQPEWEYDFLKYPEQSIKKLGLISKKYNLPSPKLRNILKYLIFQKHDKFRFDNHGNIESLEIENIANDNYFKIALPRISNRINTVAGIKIKNNKLEIVLYKDSLYDYRYIIDFGDEKKTIMKNTAYGELITKLKELNRRKSLLFRMIRCICDIQNKYLMSGDELYLLPLSQSQLASRLAEVESTVSRMIKNKTIDTPYANKPLKFFCQHPRKVISRIIKNYSKFNISGKLTDEKIRQILKQYYNFNISRRTAAYHRRKNEKH